MKRLVSITWFIAVLIQMIQAQNFGVDFGNCGLDELNMTTYPKDPSAEAVVLYDIGKSYFILDDGFQLIFERHFKIKILNTAGLKWAQFEIPYYTEFDKAENIFELRGNTYNIENGVVRTTNFNPKNAYDERINEHWINRKFAMPDVKEGSVIEVVYKITSPYIFNFRSWVFQMKIPVIYSQYITKMNPFYEYTYALQGTNKLSDFKNYIDPGVSKHFGVMDYQDMDYEFIMKDVRAFKDESFITSMNDYVIKIDFQLSMIHHPEFTEEIMSTWPKMIEIMLKNDSFGKYLKSSQKAAKSIIDTMGLSSKTIREKAEIIDRYVKNNYNWTGFNDKFATQTTSNFLKSKTGNTADINLFLADMLKAAGIEAYPVLLSTRDHGKIKLNYPFHKFFNYVIVVAKIDTGFVPMDATEPLAEFGIIPMRCLNDKGLIINEDSPKETWLPLSSLITSDISYTINLTPNVISDTIIENLQIQSTGYDALNFRRHYISDSKDLKDKLNVTHLVLLDSLKVNNLKQIDLPFEVEIKSATSIEKVEDKILITPFCGIVMKESPLKQNFRTYPVDMIYKNQENFVSIIHIPEGYKLYTKPENLSIDNPDIRITYIAEQTDDNCIKISGTYEFKNDVYDIASYFNLKGYFKKIIDKFNEKVVLIKV